MTKNGNFDVNLDSCKLYNVTLNKGENKVRLTTDKKSELALDAMVITKTTLYDAKKQSLQMEQRWKVIMLEACMVKMQR